LDIRVSSHWNDLKIPERGERCEKDWRLYRIACNSVRGDGAYGGPVVDGSPMVHGEIMNNSKKP